VWTLGVFGFAPSKKCNLRSGIVRSSEKRSCGIDRYHNVWPELSRLADPNHTKMRGGTKSNRNVCDALRAVDALSNSLPTRESNSNRLKHEIVHCFSLTILIRHEHRQRSVISRHNGRTHRLRGQTAVSLKPTDRSRRVQRPHCENLMFDLGAGRHLTQNLRSLWQ
jgi:hypothetical protein